MGSTLIEKILAAHSGGQAVRPGDRADAQPDQIVLDERSAGRLLDRIEAAGAPAVARADRLRVIPGHFIPRIDPRQASIYGRLARFAKQHRLKGLMALGRGGSLPVEWMDAGGALPGGLVVGSDGHLTDAGAVACAGLPVPFDALVSALAGAPVSLEVPETIRVRLAGVPGRWCSGRDLMLRLLSELGPEVLSGRALELYGPALDRLDVVDRLAMSSLAFEAGARIALCATDETALAWLRARIAAPLEHLLPDGDAVYEQVLELDLDGQEPMIALSPSPFQVRRLSELPDLAVDQVVIGSRSGGRIEDLRMAARLLKEHTVSDNLRLLVIPGSHKAFQHAAEEGLVAILIRSGALVAAPTSGLFEAEAGGTLGENEVCVTTTTANPAGFQGPPSSKIHLVSPAVAAATAVIGRLAHPDEVLRSRRESV